MRSLKYFFPNVIEQEYSKIWQLVKSWENDPCWDLEKTDGFEEYRDTLLAYRKEYEAECEENEILRLNEKAIKYGCSTKTVEHIETLESRLEYLEMKLKQMEWGI